jgi:lipoprotein-releasing system permease protein
MGASESLIKNLFITEGVIISISGAFLGGILGMALVWSQEQFEWIAIGNESSVVPTYPVDLQLLDVALVFVAVVVISILVSLRPSILASKVLVKDQI